MISLFEMKKIIVVFLFLIATTTLPFDKVLSFLILSIGVVYYRYPSLLKVICVVFSIPVLSFFVNAFGQANYKIFFLPIFISSALILYKSRIVTLVDISNALTIHVILGLAFALLANLGIINPFSFSLLEKGMPDLYGPMGFSPTQQVFGTLCIINLIICFEMKSYDFRFFLSLAGLLLTFNRCSLLYCGLLFFIYNIRFSIICMLLCVPVLLYNWDTINDVFFSLQTLESRDELRKGVELSYWRSGDFFVYIFGNGTIETTEKIAQQTEWGRINVENGFDFLFHSYGVLGYISYTLISFYFIYFLYNRNVCRLIPIVFFYLFVEQWFTQEFVSSSFLLFVLTILLLSDSNKLKKLEILKKIKQHENCIC